MSTNVTTANFTLKLVPGHTTQYLVDGKAVQMTFQDVTVQVLEGGVLVPHSHRFYYSKYGPILSSPAWTTSTATAFDDANQHQPTSRRPVAEDRPGGELPGTRQIRGRNPGVPWVNTIGSDDKGNAFYTEIAVTPNLPTSYLNGACNLSLSQAVAGPFDGSKSECELGSDPDSVTPGIFGASNEPKLIRKDYAENSNNSFWLANANQLLTGFSPALGNEVANPGMRSQTGIDMVNQRMGTFNGGVPTDGLGATPGFTVESLQNSWTSYRAMPAERALPGLREICENAVKNTGGVINKVNVSAACPILNAYDATAKLGSPGGWLFNRWWASAPTTNAAFWVNPWTSSNIVYTPNTLNTTLAASQNALASAVTDLETRKIPLNASFGQVQYTQRATKIPIPGCGDGSNCFAVINSSYDNSTAKTSAVNGSSSSIVMFTELDPVNGPLTKGLLTYSQSEDITSPFYEDQTLRFSKDEWITLPWTAAQVSENAISAAAGAQHRTGRSDAECGHDPNATGLFTLSWTGPDPAELRHHLHPAAPQQRWRMDQRRHRARQLGATNSPAPARAKAPGNTVSRAPTRGSEPTTEWSPRLRTDQGRREQPRTRRRRPPTAPPTTPVAAAGTRTRSPCPSQTTAIRCCPMAAPGSGVDLASLSAPQTFNTDGSHEASGTVADNVGNVSAAGNAERAGRRLGAHRRSELPGPGLDRRQRRQRDGHRLRRAVGAGQRPERQLPDQHEHQRASRRSKSPRSTTSGTKQKPPARRSSATPR